ncbi:sugar ABC transporter ATP-binding protein [Arthrobacter sp. H16F315]|jgi:ribose transport system ATP-binding protein/rhamnose transport system ATP-binding protein|nr:sugar ABC transporter ATP-binding protein [Arthrobacter sp. H16F315]MDD1475376.1 sugar ABC transporter ATP-binding protein [Arthrobacter sp. H16F315]
MAGVTKSYGALHALKGIDLTVEAGEIHALCGHNGAGKSTLVKVLSGIVRQDAGTMAIDGRTVDFHHPGDAQRAGVSVVDQEISLIPALSVRENLLLGLPNAPFFVRHATSELFVKGLLARVGLEGLNPLTLVERLSLGERQLVEIARALGRGGRLLILDEPTATLSDVEIDLVFKAVKTAASEGTSVLYVSHRLGEVLEICDKVSVFRDGNKVTTSEVGKLVKRSLIELMVGEVKGDDTVRPVLAAEVSPRLQVRGLQTPRLHGIDLAVDRGRIVALAGQIGSGAGDVLRALAGLVPEASGLVFAEDKRVRLGSPSASLRAGLSYVSNDRKSEGLFLEQSTQTNLVATRLDSLSRAGFVRSRALRSIASGLARIVGLESKMASPVGTFSGGNQQKAFLGRCLMRGDKGVLLLDEPTRGVDVAGRSEIHRLIRDAATAGNAVVFASTELDEILDLADEVVTLSAGRIVSARPRAEVTTEELLSDMTHVEREVVNP